ncbi:hypothetical protein BDR26DRAFT_879866 [Obelidium mucronatum]|nr:hypothetical protein BDR26DRAFT_879866 [Obelidium mucronatum]
MLHFLTSRNAHVLFIVRVLVSVRGRLIRVSSRNSKQKLTQRLNGLEQARVFSSHWRIGRQVPESPKLTSSLVENRN